VRWVRAILLGWRVLVVLVLVALGRRLLRRRSLVCAALVVRHAGGAVGSTPLGMIVLWFTAMRRM
jgi:hypothetical protein